MRFEELTPEMTEQAKKCETAEERRAFIEENGIELTDEQLQSIAGGFIQTPCDRTPKRTHKWKRTGKTRPGRLFGDVWPDHEVQCIYCGLLDWDL